MHEIAPILRDRRDAVLDRIQRNEHWLRESFESLTTLNYRRSFDECVHILRERLAANQVS
jgi:hypothetical protein